MQQYTPRRGQKSCLLNVLHRHLDLVIAREGVQKTQQVAFGGGVNDLIDARKLEGFLRASLVEVGEIEAHALLPAFLGDNNRVCQPFWVSHLPNDTSLLHFVGLLDDERLLLSGMSPCLLFHRARVRAHPQVMLDYSPRDLSWKCHGRCPHGRT